jgi:hypothetical protein
MTKTCAQCGSTEVEEFAAELSIARPEAPLVYTSGTMALCSACGFAACSVPETVLAQLRARIGMSGVSSRRKPLDSDRPLSALTSA